MLLKSYSNKNIGDFESIPGKQLDDSESDFLEILYYAALMDKNKNANFGFDISISMFAKSMVSSRGFL